METKLTRVPEWAMDIEEDRFLLASWFHDLELRWHPSWPGIVELICPMTITAERMMSDYRVQIYRAAGRMFGDNFQILFRPESAKTRKQIEAWCFRSGIVSSQENSPEAKARVAQFLRDWREGKVVYAAQVV